MLKDRGLVPTIQSEQRFSWTCGFHWLLDNVELIMYMKFQKLLLLDAEIWTKNINNAPKMGIFPHLWPPGFFFSKIGLCHFCTLMVPWEQKYGALTSCKKLEKLMDRLWDIQRQTDPQTNGRTNKQTQGQDLLHSTLRIN